MIQFLRGDANSVNSSVVVPADGQPVFNKTDKLLYIGDGVTQVKNLEPIAGLNALTCSYTIKTPNEPTDSGYTNWEITSTYFNRTPQQNDTCLIVFENTSTNVVYLCTSTVVTNYGASAEYHEVHIDSFVTVSGVTPLMYMRVVDVQQKPSEGVSYSVAANQFNRTPLLDELATLVVRVSSTNEVYYTICVINNISGGSVTVYVVPGNSNVKISGEKGADGKGILKSTTPQQLPNTWSAKTWKGLTNFYGSGIWTDGENIYCSEGSGAQYVLNKATSTWSAKTWNGYTGIAGDNIWTDGDNIYYSNGSGMQYVLNKATSTWSAKAWNGYTGIYGDQIWTDGDNIYYSVGTNQYVLNRETSTWTSKTWNGYTNFYGYDIWTDGENIYSSNGSLQYVLNKATSTWSVKTWNGLTIQHGYYIWTDGENIYYSNVSSHYVLNKETSTWSAKTWNGLTNFTGAGTWTDGENIYYSNRSSGSSYVLNKKTSTTPVLNTKYGNLNHFLSADNDENYPIQLAVDGSIEDKEFIKFSTYDGKQFAIINFRMVFNLGNAKVMSGTTIATHNMTLVRTHRTFGPLDYNDPIGRCVAALDINPDGSIKIYFSTGDNTNSQSFRLNSLNFDNVIVVLDQGESF